MWPPSRPGSLPSRSRPRPGRPQPIPRSSGPAPDTQIPSAAPAYRKGHELLDAFLGRPLSDGPSAYGLDVVIATLPDPVESHLDWAFDSELEAIRRAYERSWYVTDRFWLPPRAALTVASPRSPGTRVPAREVYPGVFLFRSRDPAIAELRILYVVGEVPTSGIHKEALSAALRERAALFGARTFRGYATRARTVRLLGPSFSGSSLSLRLALLRWLSRDGRGVDSVLMESGSATNPDKRTTLTFDRVRFAATPFSSVGRDPHWRCDTHNS